MNYLSVIEYLFYSVNKQYQKWGGKGILISLCFVFCCVGSNS